MLTASAAQADGLNISAQHLLSSWHDEDPGMKMVAEVIASAFASGFFWGGEAARKRVYCGSPDIKGAQIMDAFEQFLKNNSKVPTSPTVQRWRVRLARSSHALGNEVGRARSPVRFGRSRAVAFCPQPSRVVKRSAAPAVKTDPSRRGVSLPTFVPPQLSQPVQKPPWGPQWLHEIKLDGFRVAARLDHGRATPDSDWARLDKQILKRHRSARDAGQWVETAPQVGENFVSHPCAHTAGVNEFAVIGVI
jgi:hypothetical protein